MMVSKAQGSDADELAELYRSNNPTVEGRLVLQVRHESQTFVTRGDTGRITGLAVVGHVDYGLSASYGVIYELEVARNASRYSTGRSLVEACVEWLRERHVRIVFATASDEGDRAFYQSVDFEPCKNPELQRIIQPWIQAP
jgi:N-acetylglutamate synthase-like GNAT family acetyltransferase